MLIKNFAFLNVFSVLLPSVDYPAPSLLARVLQIIWMQKHFGYYVKLATKRATDSDFSTKKLLESKKTVWQTLTAHFSNILRAKSLIFELFAFFASGVTFFLPLKSTGTSFRFNRNIAIINPYLPFPDIFVMFRENMNKRPNRASKVPIAILTEQNL